MFQVGLRQKHVKTWFQNDRFDGTRDVQLISVESGQKVKSGTLITKSAGGISCSGTGSGLMPWRDLEFPGCVDSYPSCSWGHSLGGWRFVTCTACTHQLCDLWTTFQTSQCCSVLRTDVETIRQCRSDREGHLASQQDLQELMEFEWIWEFPILPTSSK